MCTDEAVDTNALLSSVCVALCNNSPLVIDPFPFSLPPSPPSLPPRFMVEGELKYLADARELIRPERNTLTVSFLDVEEYSTKLANLIQENYYRWVWSMM